MLTSLMVAKVISETSKPLKDLAGIITKLPQVMVNLSATPEQKQNLKTSEMVNKLLLEYDAKLSDVHGRLLVRPSGTEPLIRITMWGDDEDKITDLANTLAAALSEIL